MPGVREVIGEKKKTIIYIITGGNGITGNFVVQSVLAQFPKNRIPVILKSDVNTAGELERAVSEAVRSNAIVVHTMVHQGMRDRLTGICRERGIRTVDLMGGLIDMISGELREEPLNIPGLFRRANTEYFDRLESIDFAIQNDDGLNIGNLPDADIILTGVSRTGKTPLSMYLAMLGWKVSNVPIIKGIEPPQLLFEVDRRRVFGLMISLSQLKAHRQKRLAEYRNLGETDYFSPAKIREELEYARGVFRKGRFTVVNVSNKAIESSANEILREVTGHFDKSERRKKLA